MASNKIDILVYAHWIGMPEPKLIGLLSAQQAKGRKAFSFEYHRDWVNSGAQRLLDPDINWYRGPQYPDGKENFGVFMDSMPDTWGRKLMQRRTAQKARGEGKPTTSALHELDYLLGVHDFTRMGALRFKLKLDGPFLDDDTNSPTPPWAHIRELQRSAEVFENNDETAEKKWLDLLIAPGSSLGGARPKANILDQDGSLWIAKFPSKNDTTDKASWEFLAYQLARNAGIEMADCRLEKVYGQYHTFFTRRFDRLNGERIHFASAMTMTGKNENLIRDETPSYLNIAEFLQYAGCSIETDLQQLWRRIIFNIAISNTDDHLRNHGFILSTQGWRLSPAYDLNPSADKNGLALNIDMDNNVLDYDLAKSVGAFFHLKERQMDQIIREVKAATDQWRSIADKLSIPRSEQEMMAAAFI